MNTDPRPGVTVYWRPGCGFCHILRRELDRPGIERTEVNIWENREAAALVRSYAHGNETVPTVVVGNQAMVNPTAAEVIAALGSPDPVHRQTEAGQTAPRSPWSGALWTVAACSAWLALALAHPTTTYHLAPVVGVLAWPVAVRTHRRRQRWASGLVPTLGATALVAATAGFLAGSGALAGPVLIGPSALFQTYVLTGIAAWGALLLARPHRRAHTPNAGEAGAGSDETQHAGDQPQPVAVYGTGGGCTSPGDGSADTDQCTWTPGPPAA